MWDSNISRTLYNGIKLPAEWPSHRQKLTVEPHLPPYLVSPPDVIPIDLGRQLFVDSFLIEHSTLIPEFHAAEYHTASPVIMPDQPWEQTSEAENAGGSMATVFSDGVWYDSVDHLFKMWYMGGYMSCSCLAVSEDGVYWSKPERDIVKGTNIVIPQNRDSTTVWLDHRDPDPQRRFKMFRFTKKPLWGMSLLFSPDGIHWSEEIRRFGSCLDRSTVFFNPFRDVWCFSLKSMIGETTRFRRYWEMADLLNSPVWNAQSETPFWAAADEHDVPDQNYDHQPDLYCLDAVAYESVILGLFTIHHGPGDKELGRSKCNQVFVGFSRDGFHWKRPSYEPLLPVSPHRGSWNWGNVQTAGGCCLIVDDSLYFYCSGRAGQGRGEYFDAGGSTGLAVLRRDGFISMEADSNGGRLTTRPVVFSGEYLFVNAKSDKGEVRVEVIGQGGETIEPFSNEESIPVSLDSTCQRVRWKQADNLRRFVGMPIRFRFHLKNAGLYSFWVTGDKQGASHGYVAAGGPGFAGEKDN